MKLDDLKIGEVKQLLSLLGNQSGQKRSMYERYIGKYVICRSRNEGINAGKVIDIDETGVVLEDARRFWYHRPKNNDVSWYEGVALFGLSDDSKVGAEREKLIAEDYSLTICSDDAEKSIRDARSNEQS